MRRRIRAWAKGWEYWQLPAPARQYVLAVDAVAVACIAVLVYRTSWRGADMLAFVAFAACGILSVEVFRGIGAPHRRKDRPYHDLLSAFLFPAAVVLPPVYAALIALPLHALIQARVTHLAPVKRIFNTACISITGLCAALAHDAISPPLATSGVSALSRPLGMAGLFLAAVVYLVMNRFLVAGVIRRVTPSTPWQMLVGDREAWIIDVADVCAGGVLAMAWTVSPVLILIAVPPIVLLQRAVVHTHLVAAARTDGKTGLSNLSHWREEASRVLGRANTSGEPAAVLVVDLDRFKTVNDRFGHLVGDAVLASVADTLRAVVRPDDLVARFGGEEFTVLLAGAAGTTAVTVAERIRARLAGAEHPVPGQTDPIQVTASLGLATWGRDGKRLDDLLAAADSAMYRAKGAGGNRLVVASDQDRDPAKGPRLKLVPDDTPAPEMPPVAPQGSVAEVQPAPARPASGLG